MKRPPQPFSDARPISESGRLEDYIPRRGDASPTLGGRNDSRRQKWGGRRLISDNAALNEAGVPRRVTLINTGDMGLPDTINVQLRFANNIPNVSGQDPLGNPILAGNNPQFPFLYPAPSGVFLVVVTVRRGVDRTVGSTTDTYEMTVNDVFPIDNIAAANLSVDVEVTGAGSGTTVWVEAIATPVDRVGPTNQVHPWQVSQNPTFINTNPAAVSLLPPNSDRVQFFLTNTSTDQDLLIQLGRGPNNALPSFGPPTLGTFVLPRNNFNVYESPSPAGFKGIPGDGVRGSVYGIWSGAGNGGVMIHEGTAF